LDNRQPNSKNCFVCGIENPIGLHLKFLVTAPGEVTAECILPAQYQGYPGIVHGGIIAAMLDEAAGRSFMGDAENPRFTYTARLEVRYRKNVPINHPLRLVGRTETSKTRLATAKSAIYSPDGTLLAEAEALLMDVPQNMLEGIDLQALGWRIYSDEELNR
jgi:acyl-coenzyme A thioesterase PaaI-like protein